MAEPSLRLVDTASGELTDPTTVIVGLEEVIAGLERDLRAKRTTITKLENALTDKAEAHALYPQAEIVFAHWKRACNHPRSLLGEKRREAILSRLKEGYTVEQLCKAVDGLAYDPNQKPRKNGSMERYDDLEIAMRSDQNVERYANRAPRTEKPRQDS